MRSLVGIVVASLCVGCSTQTGSVGLSAAPSAPPVRDLLAFPPGVADPADFPNASEDYRLTATSRTAYVFKTANGTRCLILAADPNTSPPDQPGATCFGHFPIGSPGHVSNAQHPDGFNIIGLKNSTTTTSGLFGDTDPKSGMTDNDAEAYKLLEPGHRVSLCGLSAEEVLVCSALAERGSKVSVHDGAATTTSDAPRGPYRYGFVIDHGEAYSFDGRHPGVKNPIVPA